MSTRMVFGLVVVVVCLASDARSANDAEVQRETVTQDGTVIKSSRTYKLQSPDESMRRTLSVWIYPDWMWSREAVSKTRRIIQWVPEKTLPVIPSFNERPNIGGGALILGPPE